MEPKDSILFNLKKGNVFIGTKRSAIIIKMSGARIQ